MTECSILDPDAMAKRQAQRDPERADTEHDVGAPGLAAPTRATLLIRGSFAWATLAITAAVVGLGALLARGPGSQVALWSTVLDAGLLIGILRLLRNHVLRETATAGRLPLDGSPGPDEPRDATYAGPEGAVAPTHQTAEPERLFLRTILDVNPNFVFAKDREGRFTLVNQAVADAYGTTVANLVGRTDADFNSNSEEVAAFRRDDLHVMDSRKTRLIPEERITDASGAVRWLQTVKCPIVGPDGRADQVLGVSTDISERKHLESQLVQAQKMEAIGRLAGGIAHDFNNLLTVITSYSALVLDQLEHLGASTSAQRTERAASNGEPNGRTNPHQPSEIAQIGLDLRADVAEIKKAADRAATLTGQLLAFSRKQVTQPRILDLCAVVIELDTMLRRLIREDIALEILPTSEPLFVHADRGQLEQLIVNLAVNARDAMPNGGRLRIKIGAAAIGPERGRRLHPLPAGGYVLLIVTDTGTGMDEEALSHLFEPFFTTKGPGKGTGLGLSTVYGIVKQAEGDLRVKSAPGHGTSVRVLLPRVAPPAVDGAEPAIRSTDTTYGSETILLVEDDAALRTLAARVLRDAGYTVVVAHDGQAALAACERHSGRIDLLATDVVMPGMNCHTLVEQLSARRPGLKVLYMSGYTDNEIVRRGIADRATTFVQKPFTPEFLACKVREALASTTGTQ